MTSRHSSEGISRRRFLLRAMAVGLVAVFGDFLVGGLLSLRKKIGLVDARAEGLPAPDGTVATIPGRILSQQEREVLEAIVAVVVPSDEMGPGAKEAGVASDIERLMGNNPHLRQRYSDGLQAFDALARSQYRKRFSALRYDDQVNLFTLVEEAKKRVWPDESPSSMLGKVKWRLHHWYYRRYVGVTDSMMVLMEQVTRDASESFYATKTAWDSLGYSGPPFPFGYAGRRSPCFSLSS